MDATRARWRSGATADVLAPLGLGGEILEVRVERKPRRNHADGAAVMRASLADYAALALRREDPDTLFFTRRLVIEGDTALGLELKNALDAL